MSRPTNDPHAAEAAAAANAAEAAVEPEPAATPTAPSVVRARRRVLVLYNCDYDAPAITDTEFDTKDRSAVAQAANQVRDAVEAYGYDAILSGVLGDDLATCLEKIREVGPELIFNLTESLNQD